MDLLQKVVAVAALVLALGNLPMHAKNKPVKIDGFGLLGNAELRGSLRLLDFEQGPFDARKVDDGAFLLLTRLRQSGYLDASLTATFELPDGETRSATWESDTRPDLPQDLATHAVRYEIAPGILYYYEDVQISGLVAIEPEIAREYFIPKAALYSRRADKAFSPSIFSNGQKQLIAALVGLGYTDARVVERNTLKDPVSGAVTAQLTIEQGKLYRVAESRTSLIESEKLVEQTEAKEDAIYHRAWVDDRIRELRNESYRLGFPDTRITSSISLLETSESETQVAVIFEVRRGERKILTSVEHRGATDTKSSLLQRKTALSPGNPLDISEVEAARRRISRLGIFERVDLSYEPDGPDGRKAIFDYENGERIEWQLLLGYGSYEKLRGGVLGQRSNLFGRAHSLSLSATQSVKSTSGRFDYTVPELLGESIDGTIEASYLDREELFFDRTERGVSLGLSTRLERLGVDLALDYAFDRKRSSDPAFNADLRLEDTNIGSLSLRASRNRLDNILYPKNGYEIFAAVRYAAETLGGETEFIRPEAGASYHAQFGGLWLLHLGARGGMVSSPGDNATEIPNGERFLVGGENSLRGFRRGEAGPVDDADIPIGAEAFALLNVELEYPLLERLNVVLFADAARVWNSTGRSDEFDDLLNVGLGLRYQTIVGPVRLEYGHNIDPKPSDPEGTLHLSIGFPF